MDGRTAVLAKQELQQALPKGTKLGIEQRDLGGDRMDHGVRVKILDADRTFWEFPELVAFVERLNEAARLRAAH